MTSHTSTRSRLSRVSSGSRVFLSVPLLFVSFYMLLVPLPLDLVGLEIADWQVGLGIFALTASLPTSVVATGLVAVGGAAFYTRCPWRCVAARTRRSILASIAGMVWACGYLAWCCRGGLTAPFGPAMISSLSGAARTAVRGNRWGTLAVEAELSLT